MNKLAQQLLYANDLEVLYDAMNALLDARDELELDNPIRVAQIIYKFERFVEIHKVRTGDLTTLTEKVQQARTEYRSLQLKYQGMEDKYKNTKKLLDNVLKSKLG
jgi:hypothetical protein